MAQHPWPDVSILAGTWMIHDEDRERAASSENAFIDLGDNSVDRTSITTKQIYEQKNSFVRPIRELGTLLIQIRTRPVDVCKSQFAVISKLHEPNNKRHNFYSTTLCCRARLERTSYKRQKKLASWKGDRVIALNHNSVGTSRRTYFHSYKWSHVTNRCDVSYTLLRSVCKCIVLYSWPHSNLRF